MLSWQDLKTADEIERHTVNAKYVDNADPLIERAGLLSCFSEQPFYEHLSYFNMEEYPVDGRYLKQTGETEDGHIRTVSSVEYSLPTNLDYKLKLNQRCSIQRIHFMDDWAREEPELVNYGINLVAEQDTIAVAGKGGANNNLGLLPIGTAVARDQYNYIYKGVNANYLIWESQVYGNDEVITSAYIYDLENMDGSESFMNEAWVGTIQVYYSDNFRYRIVLHTNENSQTLYSNYGYSEETVYDNSGDAQDVVDTFLDNLGISRKIFSFQGSKESELDKVIPLIASRWVADQNLYETFQNSESYYGEVVESPANGTLILGHQ